MAWILRADEIEGLSPQEIKDKFALPSFPEYISNVTIPAGTALLVGTVAAQLEFGWGMGGGIQYEILSAYEKNWFTEQRELTNEIYLSTKSFNY